MKEPLTLDYFVAIVLCSSRLPVLLITPPVNALGCALRFPSNWQEVRKIAGAQLDNVWFDMCWKPLDQAEARIEFN